MKTTSRILAFVLVVILTLALAVPAFAGDEPAATTTVTVDDANTKTYAGFKLADAEYLGDGKYAYTLNAAYKAAIKAALGLTGEETDAEILAAIGEVTDAQAFADAVYTAIKAGTPDATFTGGTGEEVAQGYWLIAEVTELPDDAVRSLVILDTKGEEDLTVQPKRGLPTIEKKATGDITTADVGTVIGYTLTGTPANFSSSYDTYEFSFVDTMKGMTYVDGSVAVTIDSADATSLFTVTFASGTLTVAAADLSGVENFSASSEIVVTYNAKITEDALTQDAENSVHLEYSNDPYDGGTGSTGETPEVEVPMDVVTIVIDKYADGDTTEKLDGVWFALMNADGKYYSYDETNDAVVWNAGNAEDYDYATANGGALTFKGLALGEYTLVETVPLDGYNAIDPIDIDLTVSVDGSTGARTYSDAEGNVIFSGKTGTAQINNLSGTELPETGGIGTTLFVTFGMIAVLCAGVFLVTNKRISKEQI